MDAWLGLKKRPSECHSASPVTKKDRKEYDRLRYADARKAAVKKWDPKWQKGRPWLAYDGKGGAVCTCKHELNINKTCNQVMHSFTHKYNMITMLSHEACFHLQMEGST